MEVSRHGRDMNVGIVLMRYNRYGGYERQAALLARALAGRGDNVTVFAGEWDDEEARGITFRKVPVVKLASWLKVLSFAFFSKRLIVKEAGLDLVIAFDRTLVMDIYRAGNACHLEWMEFRRKNGGMKERVSMVLNPLNRAINFIERRIFQRIQKEGGSVVALSEEGVRQITAHYEVSSDRFTIIPPAVDLDRLGKSAVSREEAREALSVDDATLLLLHVGSGFRIKGLSSTIKAVAALCGSGLKVELLVAGSDRKETKRMEKLAGCIGVKDMVRFLGGIKNVGPLYAASDVFVLPSLFETFGISAIEALHAGLPVVMGRGAGVCSVIEKHNVGRAVDVPADPGTLAAAIREVYEGELRLRSRSALSEEQRRRREVALAFAPCNVMERFLSLIDMKADERTKRAGSVQAASMLS